MQRAIRTQTDLKTVTDADIHTACALLLADDAGEADATDGEGGPVGMEGTNAPDTAIAPRPETAS